MITNGYQSYTVFTYHCGSLQWSGNAVIGFKANKNFFKIHQLSGSNANSIACLKSPRSLWNNVVYQLCKYCAQTSENLFMVLAHYVALNELPFINLGGNKTYLPSNIEDSVSDMVTIQRGFPFGNSVHTTVYVRIKF